MSSIYFFVKSVDIYRNIWYYIEKQGGTDMRISVTTNQRIGIFKGALLIALFDDMGVPIITPKFFSLSQKEVSFFWHLASKIKVDF